MKTWLFSFLLLLTVYMTQTQAAAIDATAHASCSSDAGCTTSSTLSYNITVGAGSNRQLAVFTFISCGGGHTAPTVTGVTYNGTTLTQQTTLSPAVDRRGYLHTWPTGSQPTTGTLAVVVTLSGPIIAGNCVTFGALESAAVSATAVNQSSTLTSSNTNSGTGTALTVTIGASGASDLGIQSACQGTSLTSTTQTSAFTPAGPGATSCGIHGLATAAGGTTAFDWTAGGSDSWIMLGAAFKDVNSTRRPSLPIFF
jgi:hypothetical protein